MSEITNGVSNVDSEASIPHANGENSADNGARNATKVDYSQPGCNGYSIPPSLTWMDPTNRKMRVITIGAGISGILMAYQIQKQCPNVDHVLYERNADIGGTWLTNRYPMAGCDVPSHAYTYQFALYPDWPRYFSHAQDIWGYLDKVCQVFRLRDYMTFNTEVLACRWIEEEGQWLVKLRQHVPGEEPRDFWDCCDLLVNASGILSSPKLPDIPGLKDKFNGRVLHTAQWPSDYTQEQWAEERVAVIGSGASSVQTVPGMQPHAKHLDVFVRSGIWFGILAGNSGSMAREYSAEERAAFRRDPASLVAHARDLEGQVNGTWGAFYQGSEMQRMASGYFRHRAAELIRDDRLREGLNPDFAFGCRRITPGDCYIHAIQEPNVEVHFTSVDRCTEGGVVGADGVERPVDTIVCATGFENTFRPPFPMTGRGGVDLRDKWAQAPESYLGLAIPDMPNLVTFMGPTWPIQNGSVMAPLHSVSEYAVHMLKKMQNENIKSWVPRQDVTDQFNAHVQEWVKHTAYREDCHSWYKDPTTGRVNAIWPGSSLHYQRVIQQPRYEDFEIRYFAQNPWAYLGMGWTPEDRSGPKAADLAPHLSLAGQDPQWLEALGMNVDSVQG